MSLISQLETRATALTVKELAAILSVAPLTIYRMVQENQLQYVRVRGALRFDPSEIAMFLKKQKPQPVGRGPVKQNAC